MAQVKLIVEKHADGHVAYPLGLKGVVVGQGDTYEDAVADVKSAIAFHIETFGSKCLRTMSPLWKSALPKQALPSAQVSRGQTDSPRRRGVASTSNTGDPDTPKSFFGVEVLNLRPLVYNRHRGVLWDLCKVPLDPAFFEFD